MKISNYLLLPILFLTSHVLTKKSKLHLVLQEIEKTHGLLEVKKRFNMETVV